MLHNSFYTPQDRAFTSASATRATATLAYGEVDPMRRHWEAVEQKIGAPALRLIKGLLRGIDPENANSPAQGLWTAGESFQLATALLSSRTWIPAEYSGSTIKVRGAMVRRVDRFKHVHLELPAWSNDDLLKLSLSQSGVTRDRKEAADLYTNRGQSGACSLRRP